MRSFRIAAGLLAPLTAFALLAVVQAQQQGQQPVPAQNAAGAGAAPGAKKAKNYRRVPRYWGQIDLSDQQKEKIYKIQALYGRQIEKLELQIETLKGEQKQVCLRVLTDQQRVRLAQRIQAAEQEREARRQRRERQKQAQRP